MSSWPTTFNYTTIKECPLVQTQQLEHYKRDSSKLFIWSNSTTTALYRNFIWPQGEEFPSTLRCLPYYMHNDSAAPPGSLWEMPDSNPSQTCASHVWCPNNESSHLHPRCRDCHLALSPLSKTLSTIFPPMKLSTFI